MEDFEDWTVLIVDDEIDAQDILKPILEQRKITVSTAFSGEDAIKKLEHEHPTVAIIDLSLPGIDGWQVLKQMRSSPELSEIPAIAITAFHSNKVASEAIKAGFLAYFSKPIDSRNFVDQLARILA